MGYAHSAMREDDGAHIVISSTWRLGIFGWKFGARLVVNSSGFGEGRRERCIAGAMCIKGNSLMVRRLLFVIWIYVLRGSLLDFVPLRNSMAWIIKVRYFEHMP